MMLEILDFVFCCGPRTKIVFSFCLGIAGAGMEALDTYTLEESGGRGVYFDGGLSER